MPYILLVLGGLLGLYALYRFFLNATPRQIAALFQMAGLLTICAGLLFLAITGRLPAALGLLAALAPFVLGWWQRRADSPPAQAVNTGTMTRKDALEILGLSADATPAEIRAAYKKIMTKVHPDHEGSEWLAARVNQARDVLLSRKKQD